MVRWQPDARGRLEEAAMALYAERGFESTTVAEIAERAGLTERTFFRHFADKREVLFGGGEVFRDRLVAAVTDAPPSAAPIQAAAAGLQAAAEFLQERASFSQRRQAIIDASPELQERELIKLASLAATLADTLRGRGVPGEAAGLTAEVAIAVFKAAFERWQADGARQDFPSVIRESLDQLSALTPGPSIRAASPA
jgi:AcrR family transcriptional regulator